MWLRLLFTACSKVVRPERKTLVAVVALSAAVLTSAACGSDTAATTGDVFPQVVDSPRRYAESDLVAAGFKLGKRYDVEGLTGALSATNGFWRVGNISVEYEVRIYDSHEDAVSLGTSFAEEASGETAILIVSEAAWPEGTRDRRVIFDWRSPPSPKYGTYVIRSNMILLCEGKNADQGREHCSALLDAIEAE